ncbi:BgTH12-06675 [Blumeria graminis f. sp. triticale]|uniref:Protein BZZ1 n=1 Tax=Blumeria graminis f. sp. triticale TaxID=1689686 RepID=A0A9W4CYN4_BLUGR|nr:BgTH12-06675 [Blumeria graminis f. sp. triticale]
MADEGIATNFGTELRDAFKSVNSWAAHGISWLDDIQQFYRERSAIEKEYGARLNTLARKYHEKKAKKSSSLSVGDTPALTPGSLESKSLITWATQLNTVESRAAEHDRFSTELITRLADPLKILGVRFEDMRKRYAEYAGKLEAERELASNELRKMKLKYDNSCQEVESKRKKTETSSEHSRLKAQNAYHQQIVEMHNAKNSYLIAINVLNAHNDKYYHEYVPQLLDSLQDLAESRTIKLNEIWTLATQTETELLVRSTELIGQLSQKITYNQPHLDSIMFVTHNAIPWKDPPKKKFDPSPIWHDDSAMVIDEAAKVFLRNVLSKSKAQLGDLRREVDKKQREVDSTIQLKQRIREGKEKRDEVEVIRSLLNQQEELHILERKRLTAEIESSSITNTIGDVTLNAKSHNLKSQTFKIPTNCDLCGDRMWGLSAKGFDCRDCGYGCHAKCELKVPANCPGTQNKEQRKKLKTERQEALNSMNPVTVTLVDVPIERSNTSRTNTMNSHSSGYVASTNRVRSNSRITMEDHTFQKNEISLNESNEVPPLRKNRVIAPPPSRYISQVPDSNIVAQHRLNGYSVNDRKAKMLYTYEANGADEITVSEKEEILVLEDDDGGWTKVQTSRGDTGLVPTAYMEILTLRPVSMHSNSGSSFGASKKQGPAVAPKPGAKKLVHVTALYDYIAQSDSEFSMMEGEEFILVKEDTGDGWAGVEKGGRFGSVPANYIKRY